MTSRIVFKVWDEDLCIDELLGSIILDLKEIIDPKKKDGFFFWKNIYGAPLKCDNKTADLMNDNPEIGSLFKGRILMQCFAHKCPNPKFLVQDCAKELIKEAE